MRRRRRHHHDPQLHRRYLRSDQAVRVPRHQRHHGLREDYDDLEDLHEGGDYKDLNEA